MTMSPRSITSARADTLCPATPAGTMTHAARGGVSLDTKSWTATVPTAPSPSSWRTAASFTSYTTISWPRRIRRRVMFDPIRPRPTIPSCIPTVLLQVSLDSSDFDEHLDHARGAEELEGLRPFVQSVHRVCEQPREPARPPGFGDGQVPHPCLEVLAIGVDRPDHDLVPQDEVQVEHVG